MCSIECITGACMNNDYITFCTSDLYLGMHRLYLQTGLFTWMYTEWTSFHYECDGSRKGDIMYSAFKLS